MNPYELDVLKCRAMTGMATKDPSEMICDLMGQLAQIKRERAAVEWLDALHYYSAMPLSIEEMRMIRDAYFSENETRESDEQSVSTQTLRWFNAQKMIAASPVEKGDK